jgi:hypothetical protein
VAIWYSFPLLVCCTKKNLATLYKLKVGWLGEANDSCHGWSIKAPKPTPVGKPASAGYRWLLKRVLTRVARFFLTQYTKTGEIYKIAATLPNGHKIYQMAVKYSKVPQTKRNIFHSKALKNLPKSVCLA